MRNYITKNTFDTLNITLPEDGAESLLTHLNEELEKRVGAEVTNALDEPQLQAFIRLQATASDQELHQWLRTNVADFDQIISDEIAILLGELAENVDTINRVA